MPTPSVFRLARSWAPGALVSLYQIDTTKLGGPIYYFTNSVYEERVPIRFNGQDYVYMPVAMEDVSVDAQGSPAQPRLMLATAGGPVNSLLNQYKGLRRAAVRRIKVFDEFLDLIPDGAGGVKPNPDADGAAVISEELYIVDRKVGADSTFAELQLVSPFDQEGVMLPLRIVRKRWCDSLYPSIDPATGEFVYFDPADNGCPWRHTSGQFFDINDQPTTREKDACSKQMTGCTLRYGKAVALPITCCPGIRAQNEAG